jgi:hypothetical protein
VKLERNGKTLCAECAGGSGYFSQNGRSVFFGAGNSEAAGTVTVRFSDDSTATIPWDGKASAVAVPLATREAKR